MTDQSRMRSIRTPALILKRRDFGEADRLLTILTPFQGKLDVIAKGARKLTSSKTGHVELYTRADMLIHRGRDLGICVQAEMTAPFLPLRENLNRGAHASYCAELLDRLTAEGETDAGALFKLMDDTFIRLSLEDDLRLTVRFFELRLLDLVGFRPELLNCVVEHEPLLPEDQFFDNASGGVVCPRHALRGTALVPLSMDGLKLLRHLQRSTWKQIESLKVPPQIHEEAERVMLGYITHLVERRLQSVDFIRRVRDLA
ncbi:MAG: DNA repair protein RecO [Anaerolineae bacterium]|nr:DNA repair protein RecO [Anaerolineae bacterium]